MTNITKVLGRYPFPPEEKRPVRLMRGDFVDFLYPPDEPAFGDINRLIVSTDKLLVGTYQLAPGGSFDPPDIHPGDEVYYVLDGTITQQNPVSGQFIQARKGEALWLPREAWHKAYNFEDEIMRILFFIAPKPWDEHIPPPDFPTGDDMKMYKSEEHESSPETSSIPVIDRQGTTADIGRWPIPGPDGRKDPYPFFHITEEEKLLNVHGWDNPMLIKFFVSNDLLNMGEFILPSGGKGPRISIPDRHAGDCVLFVEDGPVTINLPETQEAFIVEEEEAMFIPEGISYQLINFSDHRVKVIFSIAPGL
jgi:quercetin dioxygenase-like cupin family protein